MKRASSFDQKRSEIIFCCAVLVFLPLIFAAVADSAPTLSGCPVLPEDNVWNTPVDALPVDSNSATYIATIGAGVGLHPDFGSGLWDGGPIGIPYNVVPGSQQKVAVLFGYDDESDPGPYPIPPDAAIEGGEQSDGDRHVLVVDRDQCILYETWSSYQQPDGTWQAGSGAVFDLRSNQLRPAQWTSADAAGLPILPGLIRYEEVAAGEIKHAVRFTALQTRRAYIWPARHYASALTGSAYPPMGQRFRLKASFDISDFSPQVQVILRALKKYGMILADNGAPWYLSGSPDARWDNDVLVNELRRVTGANFEAVDESSLMLDPDSGQARQVASSLNPDPPDAPVRLIFIHHSTGENWLADANGGLGIALSANNYFVSDTNYGWGPDSIGSSTDIGHWWLWFRGPDSVSCLAALYAEELQHSSYTRLPGAAPGSENEIVLFKSCFPNSALGGDPDDPVPAIDSNPLRGEGVWSAEHTVAHAKGIYIDLLEYFRTRQDKLFVVVTAPPLSDPSYAANARAFNNWLTREWLKNYDRHNVAVFDFYNVLTTNGGSSTINDLNQENGNHHRYWQNSIQHRTDGDNDLAPNVLEYPTGDDHPSRAGNLKATGELLPLLNIYYHCWRGSGACPGEQIDTIGVVRPANALIFLKKINSTGVADITLAYGIPGDQYLVGDWDGDGVDTVGIYRNGLFQLNNSSVDGTADLVFAYGAAGDQALAGDWDGDGIDTVGIRRGNLFLLRNSNTAGFADLAVTFGLPGDVPITGDWNGDGVDTVAVRRDQVWYLRNTNSTGFADAILSFGLAGDLPVAGDWDGDGAATPGVFRDGSFYLRNVNTTGPADLLLHFGQNGDRPIAGSW